MKTILAFTDNTPASEHAAQFALLISQTMQADLILANTRAIKNETAGKVLAGSHSDPMVSDSPGNQLLERLTALNDRYDGFKPGIIEINIAGQDENELIQFINQDHIWMIVKGISADATEEATGPNLNTILNRVQSPILLVPENWTLKSLERITYMADLRYCRIRIVKYLEELAKASKADMSVAHLSAKGLPHMAEDYALSVFNEEVFNNAHYDRLFFNNIRERDLPTAVDVIINGLHTDLLAVVNHRFHFEELLGRYITNKLPLCISVPLLIFPY